MSVSVEKMPEVQVHGEWFPTELEPQLKRPTPRTYELVMTPGGSVGVDANQFTKEALKQAPTE